MIIDCHGHYTTAPKELQTYRDAQIAVAISQAGPRLAGMRMLETEGSALQQDGSGRGRFPPTVPPRGEPGTIPRAKTESRLGPCGTDE